MAGAPEPAASADGAAGYAVVGRYALCDGIAAGGMATVHIGRLMGTAGFARTVAIERLHAQFAKDPDFVAMFLDEARLAGRIRHPNVVPTLDVVVQNGELLVVMEYVHGESLSRLVRACRAATGGGVPVPVAMSILSAALYGLHAAHETKDDRGQPLEIVHRDVSPQNIIVGLDGTARVVDFGVAKAAGRLQTTREGALKGKLAYMAPEQASGRPVDRRTDIYAASVVLWEALTARRLFTAENEMHLFRAVLEGPVSPPSAAAPGLPPEVDALVMRGLARDPDQRFATAAEMAEAAQRAAWATSGQVGAWVQAMSGPTLEKRAARVAAVESSLAGVDDATAPYRAAEPPTLAAAPPEPATLVFTPAPAAAPGGGPAAAEPPRLPAPSADLSSQITSLNVASFHRPRRGSMIVALAVPLAVAAAAIAFVLARTDTSSPAPSSSGTAGAAPDPEPPAPIVSAAPPPAPVSAAPGPATASAAPRPAPPATQAAASKPRARPPAGGAKPGCNPPYTVDASGVRVPKMECLCKKGPLLAVLGLGLAVLPREAAAQSKKECADAYVAGQVARKEGRLREARTKLEVCANASCPAALQRDCKPWLAALKKDIPRLDVRVTTADGAPVEGAGVRVDLNPIDGPTAFDPGDHVVKVEAKGMVAWEKRVTLRTGEGTRTIEVHLVPVPKPAEPRRPAPVAPITLTALGAVGLAVFAGLGAAGNAKKADLDAAHCAPHCSPSDVGTVRSLYVGADVALGAGLGALATAAILYAVHFTASPPSAAGFSPAPGGGALTLRF